MRGEPRLPSRENCTLSWARGLGVGAAGRGDHAHLPSVPPVTQYAHPSKSFRREIEKHAQSQILQE